ncbi:MAG: GNAT family N-acetyltransferase [archaeon]
MAELLEESFEKELIEDYFQKEGITEIYYEKNYDGAAIIQQIGNTLYLDKLAVHSSLKNNGLGSCLWKEITIEYDQLILRASKDNNAANKFYKERCELVAETEDWNIYSYSKHDNKLPDELIINAVAKKRPTMIKRKDSKAI